MEAVGRGTKLFENRERGLERGVGFLAEATRVGLAGLDDEVVGGFFQKYGERQRGKNQSDHDDHEVGCALRARGDFRFSIPDF